MNYISTRNNQNNYTFKEVFLKGLADDGGLFVPRSIKQFKKEELEDLKKHQSQTQRIQTLKVKDQQEEVQKVKQVQSLLQKTKQHYKRKQMILTRDTKTNLVMVLQLVNCQVFTKEV